MLRFLLVARSHRIGARTRVKIPLSQSVACRIWQVGRGGPKSEISENLRYSARREIPIENGLSE